MKSSLAEAEDLIALAIGDDDVEEDGVDVDLLLERAAGWTVLREGRERQREHQERRRSVSWRCSYRVGNGERPGAIPSFTTTSSATE